MYLKLSGGLGGVEGRKGKRGTSCVVVGSNVENNSFVFLSVYYVWCAKLNKMQQCKVKYSGAHHPHGGVPH